MRAGAGRPTVKCMDPPSSTGVRDMGSGMQRLRDRIMPRDAPTVRNLLAAALFCVHHGKRHFSSHEGRVGEFIDPHPRRHSALLQARPCSG